MTTVTRFAPSPTGRLHLGHVYSALFAARRGDRFLLRIEDIDQGRCREDFVSGIAEDLAWLGLDWEAPVRRQSAHMADYRAALDRLDAAGLLYPCFCTRKDIAREIEGAGHAPHGPDGPLYPGTCRALGRDAARQRVADGESHALRLDMDVALARIAGPLSWADDRLGKRVARPERFGDVVLARKDVPTSYHLAVTVDDALQGVTLVTRAEDLAPSTDVHRLLQALLDLPVPRWHHHPLLTDETGRRLAKRDRALTVQSLREAGETPDAVVAMAWTP